MIKIFKNNKWKYKNRDEIMDEIINTWKLRDDKYSLERSTSKIKVKNKIEMFQTGG